MNLGVLCSGQGEQSRDMWRIFGDDPKARAILDLFGQATGSDGTSIAADLLHVNAVAQPLICAFQLAVWAALRDCLPEPRAFAGYSVGELASYGCAGALTPAEVIRLAEHRARAMDEAFAGSGGLMSVRGLTVDRVRMLCAHHGAEIAIVNDADRLVVGGPSAALAALERITHKAGAKTTRLDIAVASHTSLMRPAVPIFRAALEEAVWRFPATPVMAGVDGAPVHTKTRAIQTLAFQLASALQWAASMDGIVEMGCTALLELGPGNGLARMARDRFPHIPARSVSEFASVKGVADWVARAL